MGSIAGGNVREHLIVGWATLRSQNWLPHFLAQTEVYATENRSRASEGTTGVVSGRRARRMLRVFV